MVEEMAAQAAMVDPPAPEVTSLRCEVHSSMAVMMVEATEAMTEALMEATETEAIAPLVAEELNCSLPGPDAQIYTRIRMIRIR